MANITRYDPFRDVVRLNDAMNQLFEQSFVHAGSRFNNGSLASATPVNVRENEQGYEVTAHLPGVKPEDIELTVRDNTLSLRAHYQQEEKHEDKANNWHVREIRSGSFARTLALPKTIDADKIATHYENGELKIELPFSEASRARRISVTGEGQQQVQADSETH